MTRGRPKGSRNRPRFPERDAAILARVVGPDRPTMASVGAEFGMTRERVRQIIARSGVTMARLGSRRKPQDCAFCGASYPYGTGAAHRVTIEHRRDHFMKYVEQTATCWFWKAATYPTGYGHYAAMPGSGGYAHRASYMLFREPIPAGLSIDHLCRRPACVNPAHLEAVSMRENVLRGYGAGAQNARKTRCLHGHPFDDANTITRGGARRCRVCLSTGCEPCRVRRAALQRARYARQKRRRLTVAA